MGCIVLDTALCLYRVLQIAEYEIQLERLLAVQGERDQTDPEEYSLLMEDAGFPSHEVRERESSELDSLYGVLGVSLRRWWQPLRQCRLVWRRSSRGWPLSCRNSALLT